MAGGYEKLFIPPTLTAKEKTQMDSAAALGQYRKNLAAFTDHVIEKKVLEATDEQQLRTLAHQRATAELTKEGIEDPMEFARRSKQVSEFFYDGLRERIDRAVRANEAGETDMRKVSLFPQAAYQTPEQYQKMRGGDPWYETKEQVIDKMLSEDDLSTAKAIELFKSEYPLIEHGEQGQKMMEEMFTQRHRGPGIGDDNWGKWALNRLGVGPARAVSGGIAGALKEAGKLSPAQVSTEVTPEEQKVVTSPAFGSQEDLFSTMQRMNVPKVEPKAPMQLAGVDIAGLPGAIMDKPAALGDIAGSAAEHAVEEWGAATEGRPSSMHSIDRVLVEQKNKLHQAALQAASKETADPIQLARRTKEIFNKAMASDVAGPAMQHPQAAQLITELIADPYNVPGIIAKPMNLALRLLRQKTKKYTLVRAFREAFEQNWEFKDLLKDPELAKRLQISLEYAADKARQAENKTIKMIREDYGPMAKMLEPGSADDKLMAQLAHGRNVDREGLLVLLEKHNPERAKKLREALEMNKALGEKHKPIAAESGLHNKWNEEGLLEEAGTVSDYVPLRKEVAAPEPTLAKQKEARLKQLKIGSAQERAGMDVLDENERLSRGLSTLWGDELKGMVSKVGPATEVKEIRKALETHGAVLPVKKYFVTEAEALKGVEAARKHVRKVKAEFKGYGKKRKELFNRYAENAERATKLDKAAKAIRQVKYKHIKYNKTAKDAVKLGNKYFREWDKLGAKMALGPKATAKAEQELRNAQSVYVIAKDAEPGKLADLISYKSKQTGVQWAPLGGQEWERFARLSGNTSKSPAQTMFGGEDIIMPQEMVSYVTKLMEKMEKSPKNSDLQKIGDALFQVVRQGNQFQKMMMTVPNVMFHQTQAAGNATMAYLALGAKTTDPRLHWKSAMMAAQGFFKHGPRWGVLRPVKKGMEAAGNAIGSLKVNHRGIDTTYGELYKHLDDIGALNQFDLHIGHELAHRGIGGKGSLGVQDVMNVPLYPALAAGRMQEDYYKAFIGMAYLDDFSELTKARAAHMVNKQAANLNRMTDFEKKYANAIFSFYGWFKHVTAFTAKTFKDHPNRLALIEKLREAHERKYGEKHIIRPKGRQGFLKTRSMLGFDFMQSKKMQKHLKDKTYPDPSETETTLMSFDDPVTSIAAMVDGVENLFGGELQKSGETQAYDFTSPVFQHVFNMMAGIDKYGNPVSRKGLDVLTGGAWEFIQNGFQRPSKGLVDMIKLNAQEGRSELNIPLINSIGASKLFGVFSPLVDERMTAIPPGFRPHPVNIHREAHQAGRGDVDVSRGAKRKEKSQKAFDTFIDDMVK